MLGFFRNMVLEVNSNNGVLLFIVSDLRGVGIKYVNIFYKKNHPQPKFKNSTTSDEL